MKPGDAGHRVQGQHEPVAVEDEGEVAPRAAVAAGREDAGSGTLSSATIHVASEQRDGDAEAAERPRADGGERDARASGAGWLRVSSQPWTRASCSARLRLISLWIGRRGGRDFSARARRWRRSATATRRRRRARASSAR